MFSWRGAFLVAACSLVLLATAENWAQYHDEAAILTLFKTIESAHPNIAKVFTLGLSADKHQMWGIKISDNVNVRERGEPAVKLVANMHGDEVVGRELVIRFAHELTSLYGDTTTEWGRRATAIVNGIELYLIPSLNPDGFALHRRSNGNGADLNRDFPDQWSGDSETFDRQPETVAMMNWTINGPQFVLSANFHGGAVVANYPWDGNKQHQSGNYAASPDDLMFRKLAHLYADSHSTMHLSTEFKDGITNGAEWYVLYHGMQDWNYVWRGDMDITVELTNTKWPSASTLPKEWELNQLALYSYVEVPLWCGVTGTVIDRNTGKPIPGALINVKQINKAIPVDKTTGDYFRLLAAGEYDIFVSAQGYQSSAVQHIVIPEDQSTPLRYDVKLAPARHRF